MTKNCCCLWILGLLIITVPVIPPEEGPDVVKYGQFALVADTNNDLEDLDSFRNIAYWDGDYYWADVAGNDFKIYSASSITDVSTTTEHTYDISTIGGSQLYSFPVVRIVYISAKWYL